MKKIFLLFIFFLCLNCSFDNKTGIWKDQSEIDKAKNNKKFKKIKRSTRVQCKKYDFYCKRKNPDYYDSSKTTGLREGEEYLFLEEVFDKELEADVNKIIKIDKPRENSNWLEEFFNFSNNISNINYKNEKIITFSSSKLAKFSYNKDIHFNKISSPLIYNNNIISYDQRGNIYLYSPEFKKKLWEFNFYKKKFKKYKKQIFIIANKGTIYASDNLGYLYALEISSGKLLWAKKYGIPFRSNIKIIDNQLFLANQDNVIFSVNILNGEKNWDFATNITFLKSTFKNNILANVEKETLLFFNTSGELYSINYLTQKINWVINLKTKELISGTSLFASLPIVMKNQNIIVSASNKVFNYDLITGAKKWSAPISLSIKPIITKKNIFLVNDNDLLICLDLKTGDVIWSKKITDQITNIKKEKLKKKVGFVTNQIIAENEIMLFTSKGYLLNFNFKNGNLISSRKISKNGFVTNAIFSKGQMYLYDKNYRLLIYQ